MMFANTKITVLNSNFTPIKVIKADVQGFSGTMSFDFGVQLEISKRVFCKPYHFLKAPVYFRIGGQLYKPFIHKEWDRYDEIYLYQMRRNNVETIDELMDFFLFDRGEVIEINQVTTAAMVLDDTERIGEYQDKIILSKQELKRGDLIRYRGEPYLLFFPVDHKKNSYIGRIRECNHKIAFNFFGDVQWFDVILESKTFDVNSGNYISLPEGKIEVWLQENEKSTRVSLQQRFLNTNRVWKVTGIDRTKPGIMRFFCELTESNTDDNFELGIVDYYKYTHQYRISISNIQPMGITVGNTVQLSVAIKDNGSVVTPMPSITYTTSNEEIATVNEEGVVTAIREGTVIVTARLTEYPEVIASTEIQVSKGTPEPANYSIKISYGSSPMIRVGGFGTNVSAVVYANGVVVSDKAVDWSVTNQDGSSKPKVQILDVKDTSCRIQGTDDTDNIGSVVIVKATMREDSDVFTEQEFKLRSLF